MSIRLPALSLVVLVGPSGSGKSTFARAHFLPTEVVSSDSCRGVVADDESDQTATTAAFEVLHFIAAKRLQAGRLTVIDATNVQPEPRRQLIELARRYHVLPVVVVLNVPEAVCHERNAARPDRQFGPHVVRTQVRALRQSLRTLEREGFRNVHVLNSPDEIAAATVERQPLWTDKRGDPGPFDIVGDVHGCTDELLELLATLGYVPRTLPTADPVWGDFTLAHPAGRRVIFVGDLVDRGPRSLDAVKLARNMIAGGSALAVPGNHDVKLAKKLRGRDVTVGHGLAGTVAEFAALPDETRAATERAVADFLDGLISHYVLDGGALVVAHAGLRENLHNRSSRTVRDLCLYGETTGETDADGFPVRTDWAAGYRGRAAVVSGHTVVAEAEWVNNTIDIDTGCAFGGKLTALRWPERELVGVPARREYFAPKKPFLLPKPTLTSQQSEDRVLDAEDVTGKRRIETRLRGAVTIREEQSAAALETLSRFSADPRWLIYLPPTMSPPETAPAVDGETGLLEHPREALAYFRSQGVTTVVAEEKHMGSRAVVIACRDGDAARARFGVETGECGTILTRTGRRFFNDVALEAAFLARVRAALTACDFWARHATSWACLDCELMPWSAKAAELLKTQYAATGVAATTALSATVAALERAVARLPEGARADGQRLLDAGRERRDNATRFVAAYRRYCRPVVTLDDYKLAPFHLLAVEGHVFADKPHPWHLDELARVCAADPGILLATPSRTIDLADPASEAAAVAWWEELTAAGGEGAVFKPLDFTVLGPKGLVQPAVKCRGREYLRIIYGPDYTVPANLARLRKRAVARKRALAATEYALGIEGLERFARREPLRRVHECAFGVLALESEPIDPRL